MQTHWLHLSNGIATLVDLFYFLLQFLLRVGIVCGLQIIVILNLEFSTSSVLHASRCRIFFELRFINPLIVVNLKVAARVTRHWSLYGSIIKIVFSFNKYFSLSELLLSTVDSTGHFLHLTTSTPYFLFKDGLAINIITWQNFLGLDSYIRINGTINSIRRTLFAFRVLILFLNLNCFITTLESNFIIFICFYHPQFLRISFLSWNCFGCSLVFDVTSRLQLREIFFRWCKIKSS